MIEKNEGWKKEMIKLKDLRKSHNLTLKELASQIEISYQALSNYENSNRQPDYETLIRLADFFNVSVDYLLGHTDKRQLSGSSLTEKESRLLGAFKGLIPPMQDYILDMVEKLVAQPQNANKRA